MAARPDMPAPRRLACGRCGVTFDCGLGAAALASGAHCWCVAEPFRLPMPAPKPAMQSGPSEDCLCPSCLRAAARAVG
jgi:hypothetical protein